ncbi:GNAT family N-acetyltransferase [Pseudoalteromonas sp. SSM20]|uniref:GNAT family N-acetyltransferase n=1 Tax=Pseudoalteromonas sp. SSM20 TaxID=3139394 RepID=UPI003BA87CD0
MEAKLPFPNLDTSRLTLNMLTNNDNDTLFLIFSDQEVVKFYNIEAFTSKQQSLDLINFFNQRFDKLEGIRWAIRLKETGELIGTCGFNSFNPKMRNTVIGYEFASAHWGKGYATEALNAIIAFAYSAHSPFGELYRIQADTMLGNVASETVLNKLGFREEGIRRASGFWKNDYHDLKCFGLLKPEFKHPILS